MKIESSFWRRPLAIAATLVTSLVFTPGQAEDIDLFVGPSSGAADKPNVLILLDNTANWNTAFTAEKAALVTLINSLDERYNVGLMMFSETGGANGNTDGGYVRFAIRNMNSANKAALAALVDALHVNNDKSNGGKLGVTMSEAYLYYKGLEAYAGIKVKRDYLNNTAGGISTTVAASGNAFTSSGDTTYESPITSACSNNYIVYISNGPASDNSSDSSTATSQLSTAGGSTTAITLTPSNNASESNVGDEWARYLAIADLSTSLTGTQSVKSFTLDVLPGTQKAGTDWTQLLKSMAGQGKGEYFVATNTSQIAGHLNSIFASIQAVNSAFASASLPVNVNTQGTYLNQVFIGMFRPDPDAKPRWMGNLKQYQFVATYNSTLNVYELEMGDKLGISAIDSSTGFINPCRTSYWTTDAGDYWPDTFPSTTTPYGNCPGSDVNRDAPDGEVVEKGGASQHLRALTSISSRNVKTCALSSCSTLLDFNTTNSSLSSNLVNWSKGADQLDEDLDSNITEIRRSVHGDVVHSRPLAIDFGTSVDANGKHIADVKVFYGANDGMLRAIRANKADTEGAELWSFIAPERWSKLQRLYDNTTLINFPHITGGTAKDYFFDGPIGHYRNTAGTTTWIFPTLRRGGRTVYGFDVSDSGSNPNAPSLMWRRGCYDPADDTSCSTGWSALGQTWSEPKSALITNYVDGSNNPKPVLIMGGGYDTCEDTDPAVCSSTKGNRVFIIDAETGTLLKSLNTDRAVPADVALLDNNFDGYTEMAYAVDSGGNVYRINLAYDTTDGWNNTSIIKAASLGCNTTGATCTKSKFLYAPEVISVSGGYNVTGGYNAVLVGSGDREHPMDSNTSNGNNAFFMIRDNVNNTLPVGRDSLAEVAANSNAYTAPDMTGKVGWYLRLGDTKEAVVTSSVVVGGYVYFSTYAPTGGTPCSANLGTARAYAVNFLDATALSGETRFDTFVGGGLPPSPVAGIVEVQVNITTTNADGSTTTTTETKNVPFVIGGKVPGTDNATVSPLEGQLPPIPISTKRSRVYWYQEK